MFKPCPNCGFLVALIAGREASQRCPRCGSAMLEDGELPPVDEAPARPASPRDSDVGGGGPSPTAARATHGDTDRNDVPSTGAGAHATTHGAGPGSPARRNADAIADARAHPDVDAPASSTAATVSSLADAGLQAPAATDTHAGADIGVPAASAGADAVMPTANADAGAAAGSGADAVTGATPAPSFSARRVRTPRPRRGRRWPWAVALPLLALLLAVQLLLSQRAELAQDATWRPLVTTACAVLGCDVPAWREPAAFAMLARNVRPHAARAGVLRVTTSLRNDAPWPQPLPVVVLSLSDVDGRVLAARAVPPSDYGQAAATLVDPGDSIDIAFDVREPSPRVVSFDFQLR